MDALPWWAVWVIGFLFGQVASIVGLLAAAFWVNSKRRRVP